MTAVIVIQVFSRYVLSNSLSWGEELARFLFIWIVYIGSSYAVQEDRHLAITAFRNWLNPSLRKYITLLADVLSFVFCAAVVFYGIQMFQFLLQTGQKSPALGLQMYWVYLALPAGLGLTAIRLLQKTKRTMKSAADKEVKA